MPHDDVRAETMLDYTAIGKPFTLSGVEYTTMLDDKEFQEK